jgi:hypothetical protein
MQDGYTSGTERGKICRCGKVAFDKKGALTKRNALIRRGNERDLRIYQCPESGMQWWHLTKQV